MKSSPSTQRAVSGDVEQKLKAFFHRGRRVAVRENHTFLRAGTEPAGVYYLEKGHVRQFDISSKSGNEVSVHVFSAGSLFPLSWALNRTPNRYFYRTMDECELWVVSPIEVESFLKHEPDVLFSVTRRLLMGLDGLAWRVPLYTFTDAHTRVMAELWYLGRHFGVRKGSKIVIEHYFTHQDIADLMGSVRETVSISMERLANEGFIEHQGKCIVLTDIDRIEAELQRRL